MKSICLIMFLSTLAVAPLAAGEGQPRLLLDEKLSAWEVFTGVPHETVSVPGIPASTSRDGQTGTPVGLGDPLKIFTVVMEDGKPVLHVSGEIYAGLTTREEFENFHFSCQFKWGEKKWEPRLNDKRDSGILYHCTGKHGAFWNVWMRSLECQVQETDTGDFIGLAGAGASVQAKTIPEGKNPPFDPTAPLYTGIGYVAHSPSEEKPRGEWNTVEIYTLGDTSIHVVNGTPNMVLFDAGRWAGDKGFVPLKRGQIQIQSEAAEIFYRDIKIEPISAFPESLRELTKKPATPAVPYQRQPATQQ
jgi:Domain of Unknown Function (DUF1080)